MAVVATLHEGAQATPRVLSSVFRQGRWAAVAAGTAWLVFTVVAWLPNRHLLAFILSSERIGFAEKVRFTVDVWDVVQANTTPFQASLLILTALLFGVVVALLAYYGVRQRSFVRQSGITGIGGLIASFLGIGCSACGSIVLSALGLSAAVSVLPLRGIEFSILAVLLLLATAFMTAERIQKAGLCRLRGRRGAR